MNSVIKENTPIKLMTLCLINWLWLSALYLLHREISIFRISNLHWNIWWPNSNVLNKVSQYLVISQFYDAIAADQQYRKIEIWLVCVYGRIPVKAADEHLRSLIACTHMCEYNYRYVYECMHIYCICRQRDG